MKITTFYIVLHLRTPTGFVEYSRFLLGDNPRFANSLFEQLLGDTDVTEQDILHLEFMEARNGLPVNLKMRSCSLDQLMENCRIITRETFKSLNIER